MPVEVSASITFIDKQAKTSVVSLPFTQAEIEAWAAAPGAAGVVHDWAVAVEGVSLGTVAQTSTTTANNAITPTPPTDDQAYRSAKLMVLYHDATSGKKFRFTIPARDTAAYNTYPRSKEVILTVAAGGTAAIEALVTAVNAAHTPDGGVAVVDSIVIAGGRQG